MEWWFITWRHKVDSGKSTPSPSLFECKKYPTPLQMMKFMIVTFHITNVHLGDDWVGGSTNRASIYSFWKDNKWWTFFRPWKDAYSCVVADPSLQLFVVNFIYPLNDPSLAWGCWQFRSRQLSPKLHLKHLFIIKVKSFVKSFVF